MATIVTIETNVVITQGGVSVVDRTFTKEYEVTDKLEASYWLDTSNPKITLCVKGTDLAAGGVGGAAITDPMVLPLSTIRGFSLESELTVEVNLGTVDAPIPVGDGHLSVAQCELGLIEITRDDVVNGAVRLIVWGDR